MRPLRVCLAASEFAPFAKSGGLADVSSGLAAHLHRAGHDVRPFLPLYGRIHDARLDLHPVEFATDVPVKLGSWDFSFSLYSASVEPSGVSVYFVDCPHFYGRPGIYTSDPDEHLRFVFFSRAVLESCQRMGWSPHVLHVNDWQTALVPLFLKSVYSWDDLFRRSKTVLTIHNIGYQGGFSAEAVEDLHLGDRAPLLHQEDFAGGVVNCLKTGILYADALTTVSETYAREIQTPEYGAGLDALLRERRRSLFGIVNGVDYAEWSPETDPLIPHPYSANDLAGKERNKKALLEAMGLPYRKGAPALGVVSRLTSQKGFDLLFDSLPELLGAADVRFVALGDGEPKYVEFFREVQRRYPRRAAFYHGYNNRLAHMIEAGADLFLMPSRYEPCGLNQMYSLRYGTPPVVRRTGGLADTVETFDPATGRGTGFVFDHFTPDGLRWALRHGLRTYGDPGAWRRLQKNAMAMNFSWENQGARYVDLYRRLAGVP